MFLTEFSFYIMLNDVVDHLSRFKMEWFVDNLLTTSAFKFPIFEKPL
jgi:hypothetical protein